MTEGRENLICGNHSEAFPYNFLRTDTDYSTPSLTTRDAPPLPTTQLRCKNYTAVL